MHIGWNLDEMYNFLGKYYLWKWTLLEIESLNRPISIEIKKYKVRTIPLKAPGLDGFEKENSQYSKTI